MTPMSALLIELKPVTLTLGFYEWSYVHYGEWLGLTRIVKESLSKQYIYALQYIIGIITKFRKGITENGVICWWIHPYFLENRKTMYQPTNYVSNYQVNGKHSNRLKFLRQVRLLVADRKRKINSTKSFHLLQIFVLGRSIKTFYSVIRKHFLMNLSQSHPGSWRMTQHFAKIQPLDSLSEMSTGLF